MPLGKGSNYRKSSSNAGSSKKVMLHTSSFIDKSTAISRSDSIIQKEKKVGHLLSDEEALALVHDSESVLDGPSLNGNSKERVSLFFNRHSAKGFWINI